MTVPCASCAANRRRRHPQGMNHLLDWLDLLSDPTYSLAVSFNESGPCIVLTNGVNEMWWPLT